MRLTYEPSSEPQSNPDLRAGRARRLGSFFCIEHLGRGWSLCFDSHRGGTDVLNLEVLHNRGMLSLESHFLGDALFIENAYVWCRSSLKHREFPHDSHRCGIKIVLRIPQLWGGESSVVGWVG